MRLASHDIAVSSRSPAERASVGLLSRSVTKMATDSETTPNELWKLIRRRQASNQGVGAGGRSRRSTP